MSFCLAHLNLIHHRLQHHHLTLAYSRAMALRSLSLIIALGQLVDLAVLLVLVFSDEQEADAACFWPR